MIEVTLKGNRWIWHWLSAEGRVLWKSAENFPCEISAFKNAKAWRSSFWSRADQVDHRQARCI